MFPEKDCLRQANKVGWCFRVASLSPHEVGEYLSSLLWRVRQHFAPHPFYGNEFDKIVWDSVDFFPSHHPHLEDFPHALVSSAKHFLKGKPTRSVFL